MLHNSILFLLILSSITFFLMNHPLTMGLMLMIQTMLIVLFSGMIYKSFWFSYSLFLIFLGGMLILFMYMTSIASNDQFKIKINMFMIFIILFILLTFLLIMFWMDYKMLFFNKIKNLENFSILTFKNLTEENNLSLNKMYNFPMNLITILLINYLFLTLIATVKITNIFEGPLRPKQF